jgi:AcrR family transcriptional regulator
MEAVAEAAGVGKPTVYRWWPDRNAVTMAALMDVSDQASRSIDSSEAAAKAGRGRDVLSIDSSEAPAKAGRGREALSIDSSEAAAKAGRGRDALSIGSSEVPAKAGRGREALSIDSSEGRTRDLGLAPADLPARARRHRAPLRELRDQLRTIARRFGTPTGRHVASMLAASDPSSELSKAFRNHFVLARRAEGRTLLERAIAAGQVRRNVDLEVALDMLYGPVFFRLLLGHGPLDEAFMDAVLAEALRGLTAERARRTRSPRASAGRSR